MDAIKMGPDSIEIQVPRFADPSIIMVPRGVPESDDTLFLGQFQAGSEDVDLYYSSKWNGFSAYDVLYNEGRTCYRVSPSAIGADTAFDPSYSVKALNAAATRARLLLKTVETKPACLGMIYKIDDYDEQHVYVVAKIYPEQDCIVSAMRSVDGRYLATTGDPEPNIQALFLSLEDFRLYQAMGRYIILDETADPVPVRDTSGRWPVGIQLAITDDESGDENLSL
jgi:hypothetical protein